MGHDELDFQTASDKSNVYSYYQKDCNVQELKKELTLTELREETWE